MRRDKQLYGWTGPTPMGVGYARYLMVFDNVGLLTVAIRGSDGVEHRIDIPMAEKHRLAEAILGGPIV